MTLPATKKPCPLCRQPVGTSGIRYVSRPSGIGYDRAHTICPPIPAKQEAPEASPVPGSEPDQDPDQEVPPEIAPDKKPRRRARA